MDDQILVLSLVTLIESCSTCTNDIPILRPFLFQIPGVELPRDGYILITIGVSDNDQELCSHRAQSFD